MKGAAGRLARLVAERRLRMLGAILRLVLTLLRISGARLKNERLPVGSDKERLLRSIALASRSLPLDGVLRIVGISVSRYHAWKRAETRCELDDRPSCPRLSPSRLSAIERSRMREMIMSAEYCHFSLTSLALLAQRLGKVFAAPATWARMARERGWRRPRMRRYPERSRYGIRASRPGEYVHLDVTILKLLDGTRTYVHAVMDNLSRKILAFSVADKLMPSNTCLVLREAARVIGSAAEPPVVPAVVLDSGVENINYEVDALFQPGLLRRVIAQVDVSFSNSMIERWFMKLRHDWLYLHDLTDIATARRLIERFVKDYNTRIPHTALRGQTPDEVYFGRAEHSAEQLAVARAKARADRQQANRAASCSGCPIQKPKESQHVDVASG
jgi:putative transposase